MKNTGTLLVVAMFCVLALTVVRTGAQSLQPTSDTYSWSGELVGFDAATRTITVKSMVVGEQAFAEMPRFKPGDRIVLTWSGFDTYADGISRAVRYVGTQKWSAPFTFPVEFVAYEPSRHYATFKFQVPGSSTEAVKSVKPGEWVTAISRHRAASETDAIVTVRAYGAATAPVSTN